VEAALFKAYLARPGTFARDAGARQSKERAALREETGMTDEAVEGWAVMLERDEKKKKRLMTRYGEFTGEQVELERTSWRAGMDEGEEDDGESASGSAGPSRGRGGRGGGRGRGRGRGRGGAATPPADSDLARRRKEAHKGSRANHNRRDQHARKMARAGGFAG
jgi:activating signal cointegrator complex subunit 2